MKPFWFVVGVFAVVSVIVLMSRIFGGREIVTWRSDFAAAREESTKTGKPVLLYFTASWCGPCRQMKRTTFADQTVKAAFENYVAVKLDVDANPDLAQRYGVSAIPAFYLLDPDGGVTRSRAGYMSSDEFVQWAGPPRAENVPSR